MPKPPVIIVDRHDHVIGQKPRDQCRYSDTYRVSSLWLTNSHGDILLAQRSHTKDRNPGKWATAAAGTHELGDTYQSNVYKEAQEEIGLAGVTFVPSRKVFVDEPGESQFFCHYFTATADWPLQRFIIQTEEVEAIRWISPEHLRQDLKATPQAYVPSMRFWLELGFI